MFVTRTPFASESSLISIAYFPPLYWPVHTSFCVYSLRAIEIAWNNILIRVYNTCTYIGSPERGL